LSTVEPTPLGEHDPFSLGDSDDEKEKDHKSPETDEKAEIKKTEKSEGPSETGEGSTTKPISSEAVKDKDSDEKNALKS
jgi:hypothetical protein